MDYALMTHRSTATANNGDVGSRADAADTTTANIITTVQSLSPLLQFPYHYYDLGRLTEAMSATAKLHY